MREDRFARAAALLTEAQAARAFPAAVVEVGTAEAVLWQFACGRLTFDEDAPAADVDTLFDLASLTKVIATASVTMRLVGERRLLLDTPVAAVLDAWPSDRRVTVIDLLEHAAGLMAWCDCYRRCTDAAAFVREIARLPLEYPPRTRSIYSDLGFILLGLMLEAVGGATLDAQFGPWLGFSDLLFRPPASDRARTAPTEQDGWRNRLLVGEVHDENAYALGGVAGHAGLFGTAAAVGAFARLVLQTTRRETALGPPWLLRRFLTRSRVPGSSRALAWDGMRPTSSCGRRLSPAAVGHTGFTGTSLWIDPLRDLYLVLLTNRVHPTRPPAGPDRLARLRPVLHDAVVDALEE